MKKKWFRNVLGGVGFTTALFIFQACYGTPQDMLEEDLLIQGYVKAASNGKPIKGIMVSVVDGYQHELTDDQGFFSFYTMELPSLMVRFEDVDSLENGAYLTHDTILDTSSRSYFLNISLDEK